MLSQSQNPSEKKVWKPLLHPTREESHLRPLISFILSMIAGCPHGPSTGLGCGQSAIQTHRPSPLLPIQDSPAGRSEVESGPFTCLHFLALHSDLRVVAGSGKVVQAFSSPLFLLLPAFLVFFLNMLFNSKKVSMERRESEPPRGWVRCAIC